MIDVIETGRATIETRRNCPQLAASDGRRRVAILIADGVKAEPVAMVVAALRDTGGPVSCLVGLRAGAVRSADGQEFVADVSIDSIDPADFHALCLPDGDEAVTRLLENAQSIDLLRTQWHLGNPVFIGGASVRMLDAAGITSSTHAPDRGFVVGKRTHLPEAVARFVSAASGCSTLRSEAEPLQAGGRSHAE